MVDSEYTELNAKVNIRVSKAFPNWHLHDSDANVLHGGILEIIPEICSTVVELRRRGGCAVCQFAIDDWGRIDVRTVANICYPNIDSFLLREGSPFSQLELSLQTGKVQRN